MKPAEVLGVPGLLSHAGAVAPEAVPRGAGVVCGLWCAGLTRRVAVAVAGKAGPGEIVSVLPVSLRVARSRNVMVERFSAMERSSGVSPRAFCALRSAPRLSASCAAL